jgi:type I restriction enzyme S subunit
MTSKYRKIGDFIRLVDIRNKQLEVDMLLGLSISKKFIPSVANTVGTDMANYKIIGKGQFSCSLMQVRRDKKIPVALQSDFDEAIISQAYPVFEVEDTENLAPEYLMMWMSRSEFDRQACFLAVGGVRGSLEWEDFCDMKLPIPSLEKQREIVREYNVINNRIALNKQLIQKMEDTAQAIYKNWFVDFELPISKAYAESIGKPELVGKPYKSAGGEMEYCTELDQYIPQHFSAVELDRMIDKFASNRGKSKSGMLLQDYGEPYIHPVISAMNIKGNSLVKSDTITYVDKEDFDAWMPEPLVTGDIIMTSEAPLGELMYISDNCNYVLSQRLFGLKPNKEMKGSYLYLALQSHNFRLELEGRASGTTALGIRLSQLKKCILIKPSQDALNAFNEIIHKLLVYRRSLDLQNKGLFSLNILLLTRITKA